MTKVVILCGGKGTRLKELTDSIPKPLAKIGDRPILWHLMKIYSQYGFNDFVLCLGYKGEMIKDYFLNYHFLGRDFTFNLKDSKVTYHDNSDGENWNITFAETGLDTETGGRVRKIAKYIEGDYFLATYGDGVADINIPKLIEHHKNLGTTATFTGVHQHSKYGQVKIDETSLAVCFKQKPMLDDLINGGFMVLQKEFVNYIKSDNEPIENALKELIEKRQVGVYKHTGVWYCVDSLRDHEEVNKIWDSGKNTWKVWK